MGLLSPWFLAGLAAVALPLYVHLLRQHKTTPKPFSSLMFFERRTQSSIRHRRLRYFLLLASRLLFVVLLALAFARPFWNRAAGFPQQAGRLVIVVDNSFSMREGNRLETARRQALELVASRRNDQEAQVMSFGSGLRILTEPVRDRGELSAAIRSISPEDGRGSYGELARALRSMAQSARVPLEVHFVSDFQQSALPAGFADLHLPPAATFVPHSVAASPVPNWAAESVRSPGMLWDPKKARVRAAISGRGTPAARRTVSLVVNGRTTATQSVEVPAGGRASVEFTSLDVPYGFSRCEIRIQPNDTLKEDDRLVFAVERSDPRKVLFVRHARDARAAVYFRASLGAALEGAFQVEEAEAVDMPAQRLGQYAYLVLHDAGLMPEAAEREVLAYVRSGGSVLQTAGPASAQVSRLPVFGASVRGSRYYSRSSERFQSAGQLDPAHPSIRRAGRWEGVKFYHAVIVEPADARLIARLEDQTPLLLEKRIGEGRVLLLTSGFDNVASDFPLHPAFVPFVEQTSRYLAGIEDRVSSLPVDAFLELRAARERAVAVEVIDPDGRRALNLGEAATAPTYKVTRAGFFELRRANGRHGLAAVNADRRESDLTPLAEDTLALWKNTVRGDLGSAAAESAPRPFSLWWYILLAGALALLVESLLSSRYLAVEREAT